MNVDEAYDLILDLMQKYVPNYWFKFSDAKMIFGSCYSERNLIVMSKKIISLNTEAEVKNAILHEIAHALTPGHHHDEVWRQKALEIGCDGERVSDYITSKPKYVYVCPNCGHKFSRYKKIVSPISCGICNPKRFDERYKLIFVSENKIK